MKVITTEEIKVLRDKSGVSVMQCKKRWKRPMETYKSPCFAPQKSADIASKS